MQKTTFFSFKLLSFLFISILFFQACKEGTPTRNTIADVSSYVYAYTSGVIAKNTPVRVRFTKDLISQEKVGQQIEKNIFLIKPTVEGTFSWEDTRTILFEPSNTFESGKTYTGVLYLKALFDDIPEQAGIFEMPFRTKELLYDVSIEGLRAVNNNSLKEQELHGEVFTGDMTMDDLVEKGLKAQQAGKSLPISWQHNSDNARHTFIIEGISRGNKASEINIEWNGQALGIKSKDQQSFRVPALDEFKVTSVQVEQAGDPHIIVHFSDPLQKNQELKGLVSIANYKKRLKFVVDGNLLKVYPSIRLSGAHKISIQTGIKNINGVKMPKKAEWDFSISETKPALRLAGKGVIMPNSNGLIFPFEAISLKAVEVEVVKIYDDNILQFLQTNALDEGYNLERVGRIILQESINLAELDPTANPYEWSRYAIDLGKLINNDPYAIYQVRLGFRPNYALLNCGDAGGDTEELTLMSTRLEEDGEIKSIWGDYYGIEGHYQGFSWRHRKDPCFPAYYNYDRFVKRNVLATDIGLIAKGSKDGAVMVAVSNIKTTDPMPEVQLEFYDYQQQLLKTMLTDGEGVAQTKLDRKPFAVIATKGSQKGYIRLVDQKSLSLSRFNVSGTIAQKGLKGFIYGERGVWRPGDSIYLNFVLEDKQHKLPANHPVNFELVDPKGQVQKQWTTSENINNVYPLATFTAADAPTGNWMARVQIGGASFSKSLRIETVKPNRLKIDVDLGKDKIDARDQTIDVDLQVNWLHGAPAQNVAVRVEKQTTSINTTFKGYKEFEFDDPARRTSGKSQVVFDKKVNANGHANFTIKRGSNKLAAGKYRTNFSIRAFEKGGDFSSKQMSVEESMYDTYTGIYIKKNKYNQKRFGIGKNGTIDFVAVDEVGKPKSGRTLKVGLYKINWRWWWDRSSDNVSKYNSSKHYGALQSKTIRTNSKGEGEWSFKVDNWGRYLVRVCDAESGHCSGDMFYAGYPWNDGTKNRDAASMLAFSADKEKYEVGDKVELTIPSSGDGRALISLENGSKVVESYWTDTQNGETKFSFYATEAMTPTIYANVTMIQPHSQVKNDLPIRLYGVIPLSVEDKATRLKPSLKMPQVLEPKQTITVEVEEDNDQPMAYTIAMVDDGLLDLTNFKTPNPWDRFYAREALGVKTWDIYDHVLGAYGGSLERVLAIGGDAELKKDKANEQANRFKPVVKHLGPYYLKKGAKAKHQITVPNYVGSVRTMVVASNNGAYGNTEKTTPVRKPLMVLATLPRVLGPTESLILPVTVFAMEKKVKNVKVRVEEVSGLVRFDGSNEQQLNFSKPGEAMLNFNVTVGPQIGIAKFKITATGAGETATQDIEIQIRNPNPYVTNIQEKVIKPGEDWNTLFEVVGMEGTNEGILEVSNIPPIDLGKRLNYLIRYPHGCIEQTTSSGFPQLYLAKLMDLDPEKKKQISENIIATINRIKQFQTSTGGFGYWAGDEYNSIWGTNYAGHFLLEAEKLGYTIPMALLNKWKSHQKRQAQTWSYGDNNNNHALIQAYRLYTLALAGTPEIGAMNRLRENDKISTTAKWRLAAAYAQIGRAEVAKKIIRNLKTNVKPYRELAYTYGSSLRDEAMILETLVGMEDYDKAATIAQNISKQLSASRWHSTQTVAYSLMAIGKYVGNTSVGDEYTFAYKLGSKKAVNAGSRLPIMNISIPIDGNPDKALNLKNTSSAILYAKLILTGQPLIGDQTAKAENLKLVVKYMDINGKMLDPSRIKQGTDFVAQVSITNPGNRGIRYEEMALTQIFPSGWEVLNTRMTNIKHFANSNRPEYQDIRDDRVFTYFDINRQKTHTYTIQLNAAYEGRYYLPTISCEAMYDNTINARQPGEWVEVYATSDL